MQIGDIPWGFGDKTPIPYMVGTVWIHMIVTFICLLVSINDARGQTEVLGAIAVQLISEMGHTV